MATALEAREKVEARVRTVMGNKREEMDWERNQYKGLLPTDPFYDHHLRKYREIFREVQTLKLVLIWLDDIREEVEEES